MWWLHLWKCHSHLRLWLQAPLTSLVMNRKQGVLLLTKPHSPGPPNINVLLLKGWWWFSSIRQPDSQQHPGCAYSLSHTPQECPGCQLHLPSWEYCVSPLLLLLLPLLPPAVVWMWGLGGRATVLRDSTLPGR